jgi:hypothetical protein
MRERLSNPRWFFPRLLGGALVAFLIWWWLQPSLVGMWTGRTPPELCSGSMQNLRFTRAKTWHVQEFDVGCLGDYRTYRTSPPTIVFDPLGRSPDTFAYTVTDDLLILQSSAGQSYTFTPCLKSTWEACTGADQFR